MVYLPKFYVYQPHWASVFIIKPAFLGWSRHHLPGKPTSPSNVILRGPSTHISPPISSQGGLPMNVMIGVETLINGLQNWGFPGVKGRRYNKPYFQLGRVPVAYLVLSAWWRLLFHKDFMMAVLFLNSLIYHHHQDGFFQGVPRLTFSFSLWKGFRIPINFNSVGSKNSSTCR